MFWRKKKKQHVITKKIKKEIKYELKVFDVHKVEIEYLFVTGKKLKCIVYGNIEQIQHHESNYRKLYVSEVFIESKQFLASRALSLHCVGQKGLYNDDPINPTVAVVGEVESVKILKFETYKKEFNVAKIVETEL